jgi:dTDP-4-dehydrorhamnose reductase
MNQSEKIQGYTDAIWNGITTLQWAKVCHDMIDNWDSFKRLNTVEGECISKFHLLYMMAEEFKKEVIILPARGRGKDKTLQGEIKTPPIRKQIKDIIEFYYS